MSKSPRCSDKVIPCPPLFAQAVPAFASPLLAGAAYHQNKPDEAQLRPNNGRTRRDGARPVSTLRGTTPPQTSFAETHAVLLCIAANQSQKSP
ncbi:MAG: hypothetical protein LBD59_05860 [Prevotellaceae bacterium]|nr:hypothetical protein [Prevotellaceae bacterium]